MTLTLLKQSWRDLFFVHWEIPFRSLRELIPASVAIDVYEGKCYVSLVAFRIERTGTPTSPQLPLLPSFCEVNVRTYVTLGDGQRAVWFFSLDAASNLAVGGARLVYHLPYFAAQMKCEPGQRGRFHFESRRLSDPVARCELRYRSDGVVFRASPGTLDEFLIERYLLVASYEGRLVSARVRHEPYPLERCEAELVDETLLWASKITKPPSVSLLHFSPGVEVEIEAPVAGSR